MKENNKILQLIYVAWRERWSDSQWGINIKKVLPRGVSGDVYNLADCLLQQAVIGSTANLLVLNYLKHSLCAHLISHAAVLRCIAKYDKLERIYCVTALLEFLAPLIDGVTCRCKSEQGSLPTAVVQLVLWLFQIFGRTVQHYELYGVISAEQSYMLDQVCVVIDRLSKHQFLLAILYVGCHEELESYSKIREKYATIKGSLANSNFTPSLPTTEQQLQQLAYIDAKHLELQPLNDLQGEPISYCVQPLLAVEVLLNPGKDTSYYVAELQMLQRLKRYSNTRLFYEIIRAGFLTLSNVADTSHDTMWGAFMFFKVPHIIKQLHTLQRVPGDQPPPADHIPEVVEALNMLIEDNLLLDFMDTKCSCNIMEFLLNDWTKQYLVNDEQVKKLASQREPSSQLLKKYESGQQTPSNINFIKRAEVPLSGILKTLCTNKVQEALVSVLCQVLVGNSFELILSVATVEGRLKTFVSRLIQCNENSKQVPGEVGKLSVIRSTLFDVSFLMLTSIVQTYGSDVVLSERGDSFFEKWVRECMVERNKLKNPKRILALCDESIVDELLLSLSKPEAAAAQLSNNSNLTWQDICLNLPGVLHHVLIAWEKETLSSADVKSILDNIKRRLFSFSVCATSFLCAYMYSVSETELLKPLNMIQQFLAPPTSEDMSSQENVKERLALSFQIIRKMQQDVHPSPNTKSRCVASTHQGLISQTPLIEQFRDVWRTVVADVGYLPVRAVQTLESLLLAGGPAWLATQLVEELLRCKYMRDMTKITDIVFAVMHLDIERTTEALLQYVVAPLILKRQGDDINEPQSLLLARLCVYCIISCLETRSAVSGAALKKRSRSHDEDDLSNTAKVRKVIGEGSDNSSDFTEGSVGVSTLMGNNNTGNADIRTAPLTLKEPLQSSIEHIFRVFLQFVSGDELLPKTTFVYQFISLLVECGEERVVSVLRLLPPNLMQNLLKVMATDDIRVGLISRLYELRVHSGRQLAVSDLCLWRNIQLNRHSIHL
ncbi:mediator of RNA polymerase II transcription subunit 24 [Scaptodrosophila lebanonensis]|uniref:Mediator of RNA polymerase II transcription subunit 24 n=1 Tax=Drosophila lebanonensis TaxID=7225 RepID=A0A6J2UD32_DROLE|nr:mediator of RNA polymerase II transcription subunit 24 [Scaptodrosophila lebanonensis]